MVQCNGSNKSIEIQYTLHALIFTLHLSHTCTFQVSKNFEYVAQCKKLATWLSQGWLVQFQIQKFSQGCGQVVTTCSTRILSQGYSNHTTTLGIIQHIQHSHIIM